MSNIFTTEWKTVVLGDVCLIDKAKHNGAPSPYVGLENISNGTGEFLGDFEPTSVKSATFRFDTRHLLYGRLRPYLNKALTPDFEGHCSSEIFPLRPKDELDRRYLFYWLTSDTIRKSIDSTSTGARMPRANMNEVMRFEIPLGSLEEQRRIVAVLDEAFEGLDRARAHAETNACNAQELLDNLLITIFREIEVDADHIRLSDAANDFGRGRSRHRPRNDFDLYGGDYPFIQTGDVRNSKGVIWNYSQTYNERGLAQSKLWPKGAICITIAANIAETGILGINACFPDSVIGMVCNKEVTIPEYVEFMLRFYATDLKAQAKGSAQDNINLGTFERARFPFPPIDIQHQVVGRLQQLSDDIDLLEDGFDTHLVDIEDLRQSLLQCAFAGELT